MNLPDTVNKSVFLVNDVNINQILFNDDNDFADPNFNYYEYAGSVTTPPCNEHMIWYIAEKTRTISTTQLMMFTDSMNATVSGPDDDSILGELQKMSMQDMYSTNVGAAASTSGNYREVQRSDTRSIRFFDVNSSCAEVYKVPTSKKASEGHYERVTQKITQYLHVSNEEPSGHPGAFVISQKEAEGKNFLEE